MGPPLRPCDVSEGIYLHCFLKTGSGIVTALLRGLRSNVCGRECAKDEGMTRLVPDIVDADDGAAGLLIECRGWDEECLKVGHAMRALCSRLADPWWASCNFDSNCVQPCLVEPCCLLCWASSVVETYTRMFSGRLLPTCAQGLMVHLLFSALWQLMPRAGCASEASRLCNHSPPKVCVCAEDLMSDLLRPPCAWTLSG